MAPTEPELQTDPEGSPDTSVSDESGSGALRVRLSVCLPLIRGLNHSGLSGRSKSVWDDCRAGRHSHFCPLFTSDCHRY